MVYGVSRAEIHGHYDCSKLDGEKLLFLGINQNNCKSRNDTLCIKIRKKIYLDLTWKRSNKEICCC